MLTHPKIMIPAVLQLSQLGVFIYSIPSLYLKQPETRPTSTLAAGVSEAQHDSYLPSYPPTNPRRAGGAAFSPSDLVEAT